MFNLVNWRGNELAVVLTPIKHMGNDKIYGSVVLEHNNYVMETYGRIN